MLANIIIATVIVGLFSLIGVVVIFQKKVKQVVLRAFISLAAGSLLSVALLDLLPEAVERGSFTLQTIAGIVLLSILVFFFFERIIHWHHCCCEEHGNPRHGAKQYLAYLNLTGDSLHNIIDGFLIASAFMINVNLGIVTTIAVILHEIPQEISDFGVLLYAGFTRAKALLYNFAVALLAIGGGVAFYFFGSRFEQAIPIMAAFAAGNFIYLATADLIPELHHETQPQRIVVNSLWLLVGVAVIFFIRFVFPI